MKLVSISITVIALSAIALVFAYFGYPVSAQNDATWFMAPSIHYGVTGKLVNPIKVDTGLLVDPSGEGRVLFYPPLFFVFLHFFVFPGLPLPLPVQMFFAVALVTALVLALSAWVLCRIATEGGRELTWPAVVVICAALVLLLRASWSFNGRPEVLLRLLFTLGFVAVLALARPRDLILAFGVLLGLAAASHVLGPVFLFALIGLVVAVRYDFWTSVRYLATTFGVGLVAFALAMHMSPYGIFETLGGIYRHGTFYVANITPVQALLSLLKSPYAVLLSLLALLFSYFGIRALAQALRHRTVASPLLFILSLAGAGAYVAFAVVNARNYYLAPFFLLIGAAFLYWSVHRQHAKRTAAAFAILFALLTAVSLKPVALFPFFLKDGMGLPAARAAFQEIEAENPNAPIVLGGSHLWALSESYGRMIEGESLPVPPGAPYYLLLKEEGEFPQAPEKLGKCMRASVYYNFRSPRLFGVTLARTAPGYNFAVYRCPNTTGAEAIKAF